MGHLVPTTRNQERAAPRRVPCAEWKVGGQSRPCGRVSRGVARAARLSDKPASADIAAAMAADHQPGEPQGGGQESPDRELGLGVESEPLNTQESVWENVPRSRIQPQEMPFSREMETDTNVHHGRQHSPMTPDPCAGTCRGSFKGDGVIRMMERR